MSGLLNSSLSGSTANLPDSTGRPFATSYSAQSAAPSAFHHSGGLQGLHNIHGSFNVPNMPSSLASRNAAMSGVPSNAVQQPAGSISSGRFASNNLPVALSQISHGSSHGGITNRGGVSPILGNLGPRITSSMGSIAGGGNIGRNISSGGLSVPALASRINLSANSVSGNHNVQGANRLMSGMLQQAPQMIGMLGNSYPTPGGQLSQNQLQAGSNQLSSMGLLNDVNSNENTPFDMNDFPQLTGRPSSAGGPQGQLSSLRKQGVGVSSIVQQNQEFSIQNEDFPALPGFKGSNSDFPMDLHQKEQLHENISLLQPQHFPMPRSGGFNLAGGNYTANRQHQQHPASLNNPGVSFTSGSNQDILHLGGSDLFPPSDSIYHSQISSSGNPNIGLRQLNSPNLASGLGYEQLIQPYQHPQNQPQFRLQQMSAANQPYRDPSLKLMQGQASADGFGLLGLLSIIKMTDPELTSLALGIDLTTLGLNLNSPDNLYKTFWSPWSDRPAKGIPDYSIPTCYYAQPTQPLQQNHFSMFKIHTLLYIFYSMPKDEAQLYAANELYSKGWLYHKELKLWFTRVPNTEPLVKTNTYERGSYIFYDKDTGDVVRKDNFVLQYDALESKPTIPNSKQSFSMQHVSS